MLKAAFREYRAFKSFTTRGNSDSPLASQGRLFHSVVPHYNKNLFEIICAW